MKSKSSKFLALARPDIETGFSREVPIEELEQHGLGFGNGGSWCRDDSSLGKKYNIERIKLKNKIIAIRLHGYRKNPIGKFIPASIKRAVCQKRCVVLGTSNPECDHKDGRRDDPKYSQPSQLSVQDFQPLSKAANCAKRQYCSECRKTGRRFDATTLGYSISQWAGNGRYMGSCTGCYWHDPIRFNQKVSKGFLPDSIK